MTSVIRLFTRYKSYKVPKYEKSAAPASAKSKTTTNTPTSNSTSNSTFPSSTATTTHINNNHNSFSSSSIMTKPTFTKPGKDSPFVKELIQTGRPNWSKAPPQLKQRYNGIFLILLSVPVIFITTYEMVQRLEGRSTKKVQQGERREDGTKREFSEAEKWQVEKQSLSTKIFGKDFFLDGFTSNTLKQGDPEIKEKTEN